MRISAIPSRPFAGTLGTSALAVLVVATAAALVLVGTSPLITVAAALGAVGVALAVRRFGVNVVPHLLVTSCFVESLAVGPVSIGRVLAVIAVLAALYVVVAHPGGSSRPDRTVLLPVALFVTIQLFGGFWAADLTAWTFALGQTSLALAYLMGFVVLVQDRRQVRRLVRTFCLAAVAAAGVGIGQAAFGLRASGLQGDANIYALYQVAAIPGCLGFAVLANGRRSRIWWSAATVPLLISVLASQSRGAFIALVATMALTALQLTPRAHRGRILGLGTLSVAGLVWGLANFTARFAPERVANDRASGRLDLWLTGWHAFQHHPVTGLGAGGFQSVSVQALTTDPGVQLARSHLLLLPGGIEIHNIYLEALADRGLPGLLVLLWLLVVTGVRLAQNAGPSLTALPLMMTAFCLCAAFLSVTNSKLLWMLIAFAVVLPRLETAPRRHLAVDRPVGHGSHRFPLERA